MKALIVEDDAENADFVAKGLFAIGFSSDIAKTAEEGLDHLASENYDIAIVDVQLPGMSGFELTRQLRDNCSKVPILILSSLNQAADRISGLNLGADDYLTKPFALNELTARVNAILRRTSSARAGERLKVRDLVIDLSSRKAFRHGRLLDLTTREYDLLAYMARNAARTVTVDMILREVWNCHSIPLTTVVESMLCKLRKKLCENGERELIHTIRGFGYVLR